MNTPPPGVILGIILVLNNIAVVSACAWTVTTLYALSGSWHSLWALLILLGLCSYRLGRRGD